MGKAAEKANLGVDAIFSRHHGILSGLEGTAGEGVDGYTAEYDAGLHTVTRANAKKRARRTAIAKFRNRLQRWLMVGVIVAGVVWVVDNAAGYLTSTHQTRTVVAAGDRSLPTHYAKTKAGMAGLDCFAPGREESVWKAAPPFGWVVPYRCREAPISGVFSGPMSTGAIVLTLFCYGELVFLRRRRTRQGWY